MEATSLRDHDYSHYEIMESGREICVIFLDYRKAFDSVPHGPLIIELRSIGLCDTLIIWLSHYLSHRKQQVVVEGARSATGLVASGVPQGSLLGPLLFSIYINGIMEIGLSFLHLYK